MTNIILTIILIVVAYFYARYEYKLWKKQNDTSRNTKQD